MLSAFDYKNNSIGFLRFLLASAVIWSHSFPLGGFGLDPVQRFSGGTETAGTLAVAGFFFLSGFLITRSYETSGGLALFLWHRFLRIFPGFWACLAVTAFAFAPLAFALERGSLAGFSAAANPIGYVVNNALLQIRQANVGASLLAKNPYPDAFNASLWTLQYEFLCYLGIGLLGALGVMRRGRFSILLIAVALFVVFAAPPLMVAQVRSEPIAFRVLELFLYFAIGSCAYLYRDYIPVNGVAAAVCAAAALAALPTHAYAAVLPVCLPYAIAYVAMRWPIRNFDRYADFSYGLYIYAFPVQQMLALAGASVAGQPINFVLAFGATLGLAVASWFLVEKPSLSRKHVFDARRKEYR